jgi:hypothetical protein
MLILSTIIQFVLLAVSAQRLAAQPVPRAMSIGDLPMR